MHQVIAYSSSFPSNQGNKDRTNQYHNQKSNPRNSSMSTLPRHQVSSTLLKTARKGKVGSGKGGKYIINLVKLTISRVMEMSNPTRTMAIAAASPPNITPTIPNTISKTRHPATQSEYPLFNKVALISRSTCSPI